MSKLFKNRQTKRLLIIAAIFFAAMVLVTILLLPYMNRLAEPSTQQEIKNWVLGLGAWGWLIVLGIQFLQIVIAFIPGEPVEVLAGVLYGGWGGMLICLAGCVLASTCIFLLTKRFGRPFVQRLFKDGEIKEYEFLHNSRKLETVVFVLFLIPGTPKDMLTYVVGTSPMKLGQFLLISTLARIPSVISSTFIGATMRQGDWLYTILIFVATAVIGIVGICYKDRLMKACRQLGQRIRGSEAG